MNQYFEFKNKKYDTKVCHSKESLLKDEPFSGLYSQQYPLLRLNNGLKLSKWW
jgi:hypothetical protein